MFNRKLFDKAIDEVGVRKSFLAKKLGITPAAFYYKINSSENGRLLKLRLFQNIFIYQMKILGAFFLGKMAN